MADSFGSIIYIDSADLELLQIQRANLGPPVSVNASAIELTTNGPPSYVTATAVEKTVAGVPWTGNASTASVECDGPPTYLDINFAMGLIFMGQLIQATDTSNINVSTLTMADKSGTGNMIVQPPDGASYQFRGMRLRVENRTTDYELPAHKSGYVWTNTNAGAITATLPSGAPEGYFAYFIRTGGQMTIAINNREKIEFGDNANVKPSGASAVMSSSGSILGLMKDDGTRWIRFTSHGTVA